MPPKMTPQFVLMDEPDEPAFYVFDGFRRNAAYKVREERTTLEVKMVHLEGMPYPTLCVAPRGRNGFILIRAFVGYWWKIVYVEAPEPIPELETHEPQSERVLSP